MLGKLTINDNIVIIIIRLLPAAVTKATGYINQEKIRIHNYARIQHMLKYKKYRYAIQTEI